MPLKHVEFLLEEASAAEALRNLLPKILGPAVEFKTHVFQGKQDLLRKVDKRLQAYAEWLPDNWGIVVLVDEDRQDCRELKRVLESAAKTAKLTTKSAARTQERFKVLNRIAVEELEAWFFGDVEAIAQAYPGITSSLANKAKYRDPDAIRGGTWETLERLLCQLGHHKGGLEKNRAAREISACMDPTRNRSRSFQVFCEGLRALVQQ